MGKPPPPKLPRPPRGPWEAPGPKPLQDSTNPLTPSRDHLVKNAHKLSKESLKQMGWTRRMPWKTWGIVSVLGVVVVTLGLGLGLLITWLPPLFQERAFFTETQRELKAWEASQSSNSKSPPSPEAGERSLPSVKELHLKLAPIAQKKGVPLYAEDIFVVLPNSSGNHVVESVRVGYTLTLKLPLFGISHFPMAVTRVFELTDGTGI